MRRGRKLRPDELDLWRQVARDISPMQKAAAQPPEPEEKRASEPPRGVDASLPLPRINGGKTPLKDDLAPTLSQSLDRQRVRMDHKAYKQLRRGRIRPDARIDLHGMTLDRAHSALVRFVMTQHGAGKRLLLVITGKGKPRDDDGPIPVRFGVLRHQVPEWLRLPPVAGVVLQVTPAHASHGGSGAYYVYLRRSR